MNLLPRDESDDGEENEQEENGEEDGEAWAEHFGQRCD